VYGAAHAISVTRDLRGAEKEAKAVAAALATTSRVRVRKMLLRNDATKAAVLDALRDEEVDILHYSGHAYFSSPGQAGSGILCANHEPLLFEDLSSLRSVPRIAFFNACQSARVRGVQLPSVSRAFAEFFLRAGVEAYLGTFWPVGDAAAAEFAATVYAVLAAGDSLDEAVQMGRHALKNKDKQDWADYVLYGAGEFRLLV
jgi:CHAT domain-containing protein